jgi:hypothetical protein
MRSLLLEEEGVLVDCGKKFEGIIRASFSYPLLLSR